MSDVGNKGVIYVNGYDMTTSFKQYSIPMKGKAVKATTLSKSTQVYLPGAPVSADFSASGFYDGGAAGADALLRAVLASTSLWNVCPRGDTAGLVSYGLKTVNTKHQKMSDTATAIPLSVSGTSKVGGERSIILHAMGAETVDGDGTAYDGGASSTAGGAFYLQVTAITGAATFTVKHSADNAAADPYAAIATFTGTSAIGAERVAIAKGTTIKEWLRVTWDVGTTATFHIAFCRFPV
jgi:hypothetical protein